MEMNNLRVESHVAQKNRRHKLRFQQNSGEMMNHHHQQQQQQQQPFYSYNPNVFPSEMLNSVARNPHLLLPLAHAFVSVDQDSFPPSDSTSDHQRILATSSNGGGTFASLPNECNNWKSVVSSQQQQVGNDHWNFVSYSNNNTANSMNNSSNNSGGYGYNNHQDVQNVPVAFSSSPFYHSILPEDQVTLAQPHHHQSNKNDSAMNHSIPYWMNNSDHESSSSGGYLATRIHHDHREQMTTNTQALCLSLSSLPQPKDDDNNNNIPTLQPGEKSIIKSDLLPNSDPKCFMGVTSFAHRNTGPLGPFTGYATILKNSKYLKPAQELLNGNCEVGDQELIQTCHDVFSQKVLEEELSRASGGGSNEHSSSGAESIQPEFLQKKARLLYMQEEVCRKYKQYLQQMQMVISSFETVAGLSAATPYVCLALKAVSRHFHFVKNVISEQMRKMVGEGLSSSTTTSSKVFDANASSTSRLKSIDQRLSKSGGGGGGGAAGFFTSPQPVWRPQRGLPERAIAVLKTWLFDHFLHPYPSDADKHMLAKQTGLTRNQVSNWFINARVRIWKPMVEEIHTLETKGLAEPNSTNAQPAAGQDPSRMDMSSFSNMQPPEPCSRNPETALTGAEPNDHQQLHDHEKMARPDQYQIPLASMDRLMSIMPYPRATFDASGLGPVSLTLGLRQNAENVQQLQQHFGGQLIHDFVG